jgi:hypothetical protein
MNPEPDHNEPISSSREEIDRRTVKLWRHEERELTGTHFLWGAAITANTIVVAASGIFVGNNKFPLATILFLPIFFVAVIAITGIITLAVLLRYFDRFSAEHFLRSTSDPLPTRHDQAKHEERRRKAQQRYRKYACIIEPCELVFFLANLIMFSIIIVMRHSP